MKIDREDRAVFSEQLQQRRRGRPRTAVPKVQVTLDLPEDVYDAFCRRTSVERVSLHALLCNVLISRVRSV